MRTCAQPPGRTAITKGIYIQKKIENDLPDVKADLDKINWVLNNFLTNAIKYAPSKNNITIDSRKMNSLVSICVTDRGQGKFATKVMYCENSLILKKIHFLVR